jgi:hypothetical protein
MSNNMGNNNSESNGTNKMKKKAVYNACWEVDCGVRPIEWGPHGQAWVAMCMFCKKFGRETQTNTSAKSPHTYRSTWRCDKMKRHNLRMHPVKWREYQAASNDVKRVFFGNYHESRSAPSPTTRVAIETKEIKVYSSIFNTIIKDVLFSKNDDAAVLIENTELEDKLGFEPVYNDDGEAQMFKMLIPNMKQYVAVLNPVKRSLSFQQTAGNLQDMCDLTDLVDVFGTMSRQKVSVMVRVFCAETYQRIADAMKHCWTFAIAIEGGKI